LILRLVDTADVLVENFRPRVMKRLGLDYDVLKDRNPRLICCAISGFGQDGPWVHRPAHDQIIPGASGIMSITGDHKNAPLRVGYPVADTVGGGLINIAANKDDQWVLQTQHLGLDELRDAPEFATREVRKKNRATLKAQLETVLETRPAQEWAKELNCIGVPSGAVLTAPEILAMPLVSERGFLHEYADVPG